MVKNKQAGVDGRRGREEEEKMEEEGGRGQQEEEGMARILMAWVGRQAR